MTNNEDNGDEKENPPNSFEATESFKFLDEMHEKHDNVLRAVLWEFGQNAIDALLWGVREEIRENDECEIHFRVDSTENTVEMWDQAVGIDAEALQEHYLPIGSPGDEKIGKDTGGSQGTGFWMICGWGDGAYIETMDQDGERWCARAYPRVEEGIIADQEVSNITDIVSPSESGLEIAGRPELERPGVYLQLKGIDDDDMSALVDPELALHHLEYKFSFALSDPGTDVSFTYEIDGEVYEPSTYDFEEIVERAAVVHDESLDEFSLEDTPRELTGLTLIETAKLPDGFEPPWTGVAMLKGGEYSDNGPYMNVSSYRPDDVECVWNGELWGWIDASDLCPQLEEYGHTGFRYGSEIYEKSGLKDRVLEVADGL